MIALFSDIYGFFKKINLNNCSKIAFILNARDTHKDNSCLDEYREFLINNNYSVDYIDLKHFKEDKLYNKLSKYDIIYVTGGNSFYLLEIMKKSGFDKILPKLLNKGIHYLGESAGATVMGNSIEPTKLMDFPERANLDNYDGLRYLDFVFVPHLGSEKYDAIIKKIENSFSDKFKIKSFTDSQGLIIKNKKIRFIY